MRGHVRGVRGIGCDFRVGARGGKPFGGKLGNIGGVNQVMRDAGIVGLLREERIQDGDGLAAVREFIDAILRERNER